MRRTPIAVALALAVAATPALAKPATPPATPTLERPSAGALHLLGGVVVADASAEAVEVRVRAANRHMRRALAGARTVTIKLGATTRIRLIGKARARAAAAAKQTPRRARGALRPRAGTHADLRAGDRVVVRLRAPRGTAAADLPAARLVVDLGPAPTRTRARTGS